jgi:hypothetical protein
MKRLLTLLLLATPALARPVTYPGGSMSMTEVNGDSVLTQVDHTVSRSFAGGAYALSERGGERLSAGLVANALLMRRNTEDSQANAYLMLGAGPSWVRRHHGRGRDAKASGWVQAEADWETRRLFFGGMASASVVGDDVEGGYRLRAGVAPYVANSGALHTWLFVQAGRIAEPGARFELTPVVRLFKGPVLAEAGVSHRGRAFGTLWFYF